MTNLLDIHTFALTQIKQRFSLNPVSLKHPLPERPIRTLGLVKIDGEIYSSEKLSRVVFLRVCFPVYLNIRSMFIRPRMEYDLPVFAAEVMLTGKKRTFIVDIHRTGTDTGHDDSALFEQLIAIRNRYPELEQKARAQKGKIQDVFSRAACQVRITEDLDYQALSIFREYLKVFMEMVKKAEPFSGDALEQIQQAYQAYLKTLVEHDPGVKGFKLLFGEKGGIERSMNMHFDQ